MAFTEPDFSNRWTLELMVANLIGKIMVPKPGGLLVQYQLTSDDRQFLPAPHSGIMSTTTECHSLFRQLGKYRNDYHI